MLLPSDPPPEAAPFVDLDLVRKYAMPGPRYTSYPPANRFGDDLIALDLERALVDDNADPDRPLSLYFHLPFCASRCWYCGCTTIITRRQDWAGAYLSELKREIALVASRLDARRPVEQLHLGGGTPTFLAPGTLRALGEAIHASFRFAPDAELSIEIDPRCVTPEHVAVMAEIGFNRASLGIQDTNTKVQRAIHRVQSPDLNRRAVAMLREAGIHHLNFDLIYGLPLQTPDTVATTVDDVLRLRPDRLSVFSYAHVPWLKPAQRIFDRKGQMPAPADKLAMFAVMRRKLLEAGYVDVGLDHFARPADELVLARAAGTLHRNFQGYSTRSGASLYGFGISSISATPDVYWQNPKSMAAYREALACGDWPAEKGHRLSTEDTIRRHLVMSIMCERKLDFARILAEWGRDVPREHALELAGLAPMEADGLVEISDDKLQVTVRGEPFLRVVAMVFDQTLLKRGRAHALTV